MKTGRSVAWAYFDTSALVKRYIDEPGRQDVLRLMRRHDCVTSAVTTVELRSALRRRAADGSLEGGRVAEIVRRITSDRAFWTLVSVSAEVLVAAEALVAAHPLRTLDAIHVASAQLFGARLGSPAPIFVSADARQTTAAAVVGMTTSLIEPKPADL